MGINKRIAWIDILKFWGILAIYVGHYGEDAGNIYPFVYTFHVPLFFFASGFFYKEVEWKSVPVRILKYMDRLLIPWALFTILRLIEIGFVVRWDERIFEYIKLHLWARRGSGVGGLWFICGLFSLSVFHMLLRTLVKSKYVTFGIALFLFVIRNPIINFINDHNMGIFNIDAIPEYLVFYTLGNILFALLNDMAEKKYVKYILVALTFPVAFSVYSYGQVRQEYILYYKPSFMPENIAIIILVLILIMLCYSISVLMSRFILFSNMGTNTLIFCGIEYTLRDALAPIWRALGVMDYILATPFTVLLYSFAMLILCHTTCAWFINRYIPVMAGKGIVFQKLVKKVEK